MAISMYTVLLTLESQPDIFVLVSYIQSFVEINFPRFSHPGWRILR